MQMCWNWHTGMTQNHLGKPVEVRILSSAPLLKDKETSARLFREMSEWRDERNTNDIYMNKQLYKDFLEWNIRP